MAAATALTRGSLGFYLKKIEYLFFCNNIFGNLHKKSQKKLKSGRLGSEGPNIDFVIAGNRERIAMARVYQKAPAVSHKDGTRATAGPKENGLRYAPRSMPAAKRMR